MRDVCVISNLSSAEELSDVRRRCVGSSVLVCEEGGMRMVVSGKSISLGSSQVVVIPYDRQLSAVKLSSSARVSMLVVSNLYMLRFIPVLGNGVLSIYRELSLKPVHVSTCGVLCRLIQCIDDWDASGMEDAVFIDSTICSLVSALTNGIELSDNNDVGFEGRLVSKFVKLVGTEIRSHHDVAWYSHQLGVSSKRLSKEVETAFSNDAQIILNNLLVQVIIVDLNDGNGKMIFKDFTRYGFKSSSAMSHFIKRTTGHSMSELRGSNRWRLLAICGAVLGVLIAVTVYFACSRTISIFQNPEALTGREALKPADSTKVQVIQSCKDTVENQQP